MNCHGCKWLDAAQHGERGAGYCCMVQRSKAYKPGDRVRRSDSKRCELYHAGDWKTRWEKPEK